MELHNMSEIVNFKRVLDLCVGDVWMVSTADGKTFDLKDKAAQDVVFRRMLNKKGYDLELFAAKREDESRLIGYLCELNTAA